jgi:hypothetical protein
MNFFAVFLAFLVAVVSIDMLGTSLDRRHVLEQQQELRYLAPAEDLAHAAIQSAIASQVQANPGAAITAIALPTAATSVCGAQITSDVCPSYIATATMEGATTAGGSGPPSTGTDSCTNANDATGVDETCVSLLMSIKLVDSHGSPIATRTQKLTYRTLDAEPYAILAGSADLVSGATSSEANANGCDPSNPGTCLASPPPGSLTDTRFHSYTECQSGLTLCQGTDPKTGLPYGYRESSKFQTQGYTNGNQSATSWNH